MWSSLAWLTQAHWACGQVTIKKVIFLPDVQSSQTKTYLSSAAAGCISVYPWNPKSDLPFEKLKPKVKGTCSHRHFTCPVKNCRVQLSSKLPAKHRSHRRMKPSTGSHLPSEDVKDIHSCWLHCLTAAMPDYSRIFRVTKRVRTSMSMNNAQQQLGQVPVAPSVPVVWWLPLQPRRGHLFSRRLDSPPAPTRVPEQQAKAENHCFCSFLFVPLPFCPFTFTSCQSRLLVQIQAKFCNYQ